MNPINVCNISKVYKIKPSGGAFNMLFGKNVIIQALDNVSFDVKKGEIFGLIGPNGAGKTTLIKILATTILPDGGDVKINGLSIKNQSNRVKGNLGVVFGESTRSFYWRLSGRENLRLFATLHNMDKKEAEERINYLLGLLGLEKQADTAFCYYSSGMKAKLSFARALLHNPDILLLDEPTNAIDPITTFELKKFIKKELKEKQRKSIIFTTHQLHQVAELCDRIGILHKGHLIKVGTMSSLRKFAKSEEYILELTLNKNVKSFANKLTDLKDVLDISYKYNFFSLKLANPSVSLKKIMNLADKCNCKINHLKLTEPDIDEIFRRILNGTN